MEPYTITTETLFIAICLAFTALILTIWLPLIVQGLVKPKIKKFLDSKFWQTFSLILYSLKYPFFLFIVFIIFSYIISR
jgi:hypothetical protein